MLIICPHCSQKMKGPSSNIGSTARCPRCGKSFTVGRPHPKHLPPQPGPAEEIIEGTPVEAGTWEPDIQNVNNGLEVAHPSRRDREAAILGSMVNDHQPVASDRKGSRDWYVIVSDFEMDGPFTGEQIVAAIRQGTLASQTRLQRGQTRTTVADLTERLRKKIEPGYR